VVEVHREPWDFDDLVLRTPCRGCGRPITLKFNGGELDGDTCCGYRYALEHVRIDFVIERAEKQRAEQEDDRG
jgi:hypothetical protein